MSDIREKLSNLSHEDLVEFIASIDGDSKSLDKRIDTLLSKDGLDHNAGHFDRKATYLSRQS